MVLGDEYPDVCGCPLQKWINHYLVLPLDALMLGLFKLLYCVWCSPVLVFLSVASYINLLVLGSLFAFLSSYACQYHVPCPFLLFINLAAPSVENRRQSFFCDLSIQVRVVVKEYNIWVVMSYEIDVVWRVIRGDAIICPVAYPCSFHQFHQYLAVLAAGKSDKVAVIWVKGKSQPFSPLDEGDACLYFFFERFHSLWFVVVLVLCRGVHHLQVVHALGVDRLDVVDLLCCHCCASFLSC